MRYVVEGTWTGYTSAQYRIVHREVVNAKRVERLRKLHKIVYTDGTALIINVREANYRERIKEVNSYGALIREAEAKGQNVFRVGIDDEKPKSVTMADVKGGPVDETNPLDPRGKWPA